jgi:hypothetical protein
MAKKNDHVKSTNKTVASGMAPPPRPKSRYGGHHTKLTLARREKFLACLAGNGGIVIQACEDCQVSRDAIYALRAKDKDFAAAFDEARDRGIDLVEDTALELAMQGNEEPIMFQGVCVGYVRKKSTSLLHLLLKANRNKYRDRQELTGPDGSPLGGAPTLRIVLPHDGRNDPMLLETGKLPEDTEPKPDAD